LPEKCLYLRTINFILQEHKGRPHTHEKAEGAATNIEDAITV
jgi:hypothetical protein